MRVTLHFCLTRAAPRAAGSEDPAYVGQEPPAASWWLVAGGW